MGLSSEELLHRVEEGGRSFGGKAFRKCVYLLVNEIVYSCT